MEPIEAPNNHRERSIPNLFARPIIAHSLPPLVIKLISNPVKVKRAIRIVRDIPFSKILFSRKLFALDHLKFIESNSTIKMVAPPKSHIENCIPYLFVKPIISHSGSAERYASKLETNPQKTKTAIANMLPKQPSLCIIRFSDCLTASL